MSDDPNVMSLVGRTIEGVKIEKVIGYGKPKNNWDSNLTTAVVQSGSFYYMFHYGLYNSGCRIYRWMPAYPFEVRKENIKAHLEQAAWGGYDNGQGTPVYLEKVA